MKIGLVCPYHMFRGGGVQEHVQALYEELTIRGHDVKIITPLPRDYDGPIPSHVITIGVSANVKAFLNTQSQFSASVDTEAIDQMLAAENFDLLHFHEPFVPFLSRQIITRSQCVNVATSHAKIPDRFTSKTIINVFLPYTKSMLKYIHAYTAPSDPAAEYIRSLTDEKIHIIPNGINLEKYRPKKVALRTGKKKILYIGRLEKRKGVRYLLRAYAQLSEKHKDVQLQIAGDGPEMDALKQQVEEYNIPNVSFLGYISESDKIKLLHNADLLCAPSRYGEGFGIVLLEGMAAGIPVVAGDNSGYESVLVERGTLSLVDPQDTANFARRLEIFLYDDDLQGLWMDWASEYVKQFDYPNIVDLYERLYKQAFKKYASQQAS
jgi:phosphatidylinositol alpha-mannosyltransferase